MKAFFNRRMFWTAVVLAIFPGGLTLHGAETGAKAVSTWKVGTPIVTYWESTAITDAVAQQMVDGGFNLVWCRSEKELDVAHRYGLRAQFHNGLISPASLDNPAQRTKLDALIDRVRKHPALYAYYVRDEPNARDFPGLGRIVAYLRQHDPEHLAYINIFPTYASSQQLNDQKEQLDEQKKQLGTKGDTVTAYAEHVQRYIAEVQPSLLSYDHYPFHVKGDTGHYFLNLAMIRQFTQQAGLPFLNIAQASSWNPAVRIPNGDEMRYFVYTTLAYGAQGISYFVYYHPSCKGGIALSDGTPTPIYHALKSLNREFVAIATEYQPLRSLVVYHAGMTPPGTEPLPSNAPFRLDPPVPAMKYVGPKPVKGVLLGYFGSASNGNESAQPTHVLVVNLDYKSDAVTTLVGPGNLEVFDATARTWSPATSGRRAELRLPPGGGKLVRMADPKGK